MKNDAIQALGTELKVFPWGSLAGLWLSSMLRSKQCVAICCVLEHKGTQSQTWTFQHSAAAGKQCVAICFV